MKTTIPLLLSAIIICHLFTHNKTERKTTLDILELHTIKEGKYEIIYLSGNDTTCFNGTLEEYLKQKTKENDTERK